MATRIILIFAFLISAGACFAQQKANLTASGTTCGATNCLSTTIDAVSGGATITLTGTFSGTVQFEASGDGGTTWVAVNATPSNSTTAVTSSTGDGVWQVNIAGYTGLRARVSSYSSGTVVASIITSIASARAGGGGGGGGSGTVTSVAVSGCLGGGPITTSGTITSSSCATLASPTFTGTVTLPLLASTTNCSAAGTAASPSVVSCSAAPAGSFSCATNASTATCVVDTTAVTASSEIFIQPTAAATISAVTCNTTSDTGLTAPRLSSQSASTSFTINLGTFSTHPLCFNYFIVN